MNSIDETADRIGLLLRNPQLRERLGARAKETVRENFLLSHLVEEWVDLLVGLNAHVKTPSLAQ